MEEQDACCKTVFSDREAVSMNSHQDGKLNNTWTTANMDGRNLTRFYPTPKSYREWMTAERENKSSLAICLLINYPIPSGQPQNIKIWTTINGLSRFNFYVYILQLHIAITNQKKETTNREGMGRLGKIMQTRYFCENIFNIR